MPLYHVSVILPAKEKVLRIEANSVREAVAKCKEKHPRWRPEAVERVVKPGKPVKYQFIVGFCTGCNSPVLENEGYGHDSEGNVLCRECYNEVE